MDVRDRISLSEGYRAMFRFLEDYFERTRADEIAVLLGSMNLAEDGKPMDPAMWQDWITAVQKTISGDQDDQGST